VSEVAWIGKEAVLVLRRPASAASTPEENRATHTHILISENSRRDQNSKPDYSFQVSFFVGYFGYRVIGITAA
jgi:hypothetical protein